MRFGFVTIHGGFFILLGLMLFFDAGGMFFCLCLAALLHEAGHLALLLPLGGRIETLHCSLFGLYLQVASYPTLSYGREMAATLAGPLFSLAGCFLLPPLCAPFLSEGLRYALSGTLFIQGVFNLLPARSLDGGRALFLCLAALFGEEAAARTMRVTTGVTVFLLAIGAILAYYYSGFDFSLFALFGYGIVSLLLPGGQYERKNQPLAATSE